MRKTIYVSVYSDFNTRYFKDATVSMIKEMQQANPEFVKFHEVFQYKKELQNSRPLGASKYHVLITDNVKVTESEWCDFEKMRRSKIFTHILVFTNKRDNYSKYKWVHELTPDAVISCEDGKDRIKSAFEAMCYYGKKPHSSSVKESADKVKSDIVIDINGRKKVFTTRDIQILQMYANDFDTSEIIAELKISRSGFHKVKNRLCELMAVKKVQALIARAVDLGLIHPHY